MRQKTEEEEEEEEDVTPNPLTKEESSRVYKCDVTLFDMSSNGLMGGPWPINAAIYSRTSAVSLKIWLCETTQNTLLH